MNLVETRCGNEVVVCDCCGRFASPTANKGAVLNHARSCDTNGLSERVHLPAAIVVAPVAAVSAVKVARVAADGSLGSDKTFDAFQQGLIGESSAMNQDF